MANIDFKGKNILITGGSRGIGKATALAFASKGANVGINYRSNEQAALDTLNELPGKNHGLFQYDIGEKDSPESLIRDFTGKFGRIDLLVNNAGVSSFHNIDNEFDEWNEAWEHILNVNLIAAANLCYWASREMKRHNGGKIINVSSRGAFRGEPDQPAYAASKAGLNAMSQSMAKALAKYRVYVYVVAPGFTETDMGLQALSEKEKTQLMQESPFGRMATPAEVANAILMLASDGLEYASGAILDINGASYLRT